MEHRSPNGSARGKSRAKVLVDPPAAPIGNRCRLSSSRGTRSRSQLWSMEIRTCDLDSRTRKELPRATVKVATAELHARERAHVFPDHFGARTPEEKKIGSRRTR